MWQRQQGEQPTLQRNIFTMYNTNVHTECGWQVICMVNLLGSEIILPHHLLPSTRWVEKRIKWPKQTPPKSAKKKTCLTFHQPWPDLQKNKTAMRLHEIKTRKIRSSTYTTYDLGEHKYQFEYIIEQSSHDHLNWEKHWKPNGHWWWGVFSERMRTK